MSVMCFREANTPGILAEYDVTAARTSLDTSIRRLLSEADRRQVRTVEESAFREFKVLIALYPGHFNAGRCEESRL